MTRPSRSLITVAVEAPMSSIAGWVKVPSDHVGWFCSVPDEMPWIPASQSAVIRRRDHHERALAASTRRANPGKPPEARENDRR